MWSKIGDDPRNLRLGLSADGINPHITLSSKYSCWPVILTIYNIPPWLCMKQKFIMLMLLGDATMELMISVFVVINTNDWNKIINANLSFLRWFGIMNDAYIHRYAH